MFRMNGQLVSDTTLSFDINLDDLIRMWISPLQEQTTNRHQTTDWVYSLPTGERFRIHWFRERGRTVMAIRKLMNRFQSLEELHLPLALKQLADLRDGLVLVTGPTGSGKTTTLATILHQINQSRSCHIITIEDPIEYLHTNIQSMVHQREVYTDVPSFAEAIQTVLREDPDVILIGEMRDRETVQAALRAAETGHLVFSTLHTGDAVGALDRILNFSSAHEQEWARHQLSNTLRAVIAQRLLPLRVGEGSIPVVEILRVTQAVAHLIRSGKMQQIYSIMQMGREDGMQTFDQELARLLHNQWIHLSDARRMAKDWRFVETEGQR